MGLETATFISGLTSAWPISADPKSQGDDHLRLLKSVLQSTFPVATKPFYFTRGNVLSSNYTAVAADANTVFPCTTAGGSFAITLPTTLTAADAGWRITVVKYSTDNNAVTVGVPSGIIKTQFGDITAGNVTRVGCVCAEAHYVWTGTFFICVKPGPLIGTTINFDGPAAPAGHLFADGATFSAATFQELYLAFGSNNVLLDKRGRVEAGIDTGVNRLTSSMSGHGLGATGGLDTHQLTLAQLASHSHANSINAGSHSHNYDRWNQGVGGGTGVAGFLSTATPLTATATNSVGSGDTINNASAGSDQAHNNVQPTIITNKYVRAC